MSWCYVQVTASSFVMPSKYQCQVCSRRFVHKETLKEHKLLHGLVIIDDNKFSCPICEREVICRSGLHQHGKNYCIKSKSVQAVKGDDHMSSDETKLENGASVRGNSQGEGIKLRLKNKNCKWKDTAETDVTDASGVISCKICSKSFVYQKCLQKHAALVHGLSSENRPKTEAKPAGIVAERVVLPRQAKCRADFQQSAVKENISSVSHNQNSVSTSGDDADSVLADTKERVSEIPAQAKVSEVDKAAELKVDPSDLKCKTCLKQFKHKAMLLRHMHMIHGETDFERCACPLCLQKFCSQCTFSKHFDAEHKTNAAEILASMADGNTGPSAAVSYTHLTLPTNREV